MFGVPRQKKISIINVKNDGFKAENNIVHIQQKNVRQKFRRK